jgi:hypothetical protein
MTARVLGLFVAGALALGTVSMFENRGASIDAVAELVGLAPSLGVTAVLGATVVAGASACAFSLVVGHRLGAHASIALLTLFSLVLLAEGLFLPAGWSRPCSCFSVLWPQSVAEGLFRNGVLIVGLATVLALERRAAAAHVPRE